MGHNQERPPQFPSPANNKPSTQFVFLWFFSCIIEVYYHSEIRNCLSIPFTHSHPSIIIQLLQSQKKRRKKKKQSSNSVDKAEKNKHYKVLLTLKRYAYNSAGICK